MHWSQVDRDVSPTEVAEPRSLALSLQQINTIHSAVTEKEKKLLRTQYGIKESPNPLFRLSTDLFM